MYQAVGLSLVYMWVYRLSCRYLDKLTSWVSYYQITTTTLSLYTLDLQFFVLWAYGFLYISGLTDIHKQINIQEGIKSLIIQS